jgi:hypothetical protein
MHVSGEVHTPAALILREYNLVPIGQESGWDLESLSTLRKTENSPVPARECIYDGPTSSMDAVLTGLQRTTARGPIVS